MPGAKFYFGYKTTKRDNGYYYGSSKYLKEDIQKYGIQCFKKTIVRYYETEEKALEAEEKYLQKVNASNNPIYYNRINGNKRWSTANKVYVSDEFKKTHYKNFLKGNQRTAAQKRRDETVYKEGRSEERVKADKEHSKRMRGRRLPEIALIRSKETQLKNRDQINEKLRNYHLGKTKENNEGRKITSDKLKGNQNGRKGDLKLANMTEQEFRNFLTTKSQHPNVQQMLKTRRNNALIFLQTGTWGTYKRRKNSTH